MKLTLHFGKCCVKLAFVFYTELETRMTQTTTIFLATLFTAKEVWQIRIVVYFSITEIGLIMLAVSSCLWYFVSEFAVQI